MNKRRITPSAVFNVVLLSALLGLVANVVIYSVRATVFLFISGKIRGLIMKEQNACGCGRSPTGKCIGWHSLSEEKYRERETAYLAKQANKNNV